MKMLEIYEYLNSADKFSIQNHICVAVVMLMFIFFTAFFTVFRMSKLTALQQVKKLDRHSVSIEQARQKFKSKIKARKVVTKSMSSELDSFVSKSEMHAESLRSRTKGLTMKDFRLYKPLFENLRKKSKLALLINFFLIARRLILLYVAMFLSQSSWLQVTIFTAMSQMSLAYMGYSRPYTNKLDMSMSLVNEWFTLLISYLVLAINGICNEGSQYQAAGEIISYFLYTVWTVNAIAILADLILMLINKCRQLYYRRCKRKKNQAERPGLKRKAVYVEKKRE